MKIRPPQEADDRSTFRSDDPDLDRFLAKYAGQNQFRHHLGTTYVAVDGNRVWGYATVAAAQLEFDELPVSLRRKLPRYPLPVLRLARLAVDQAARDRGIGRALVRHVFRLALSMAERFGCTGVVVDAKPDVVEYYRRFGFEPIALAEGQLGARPEPTPLFVPLDLIAAAIPALPPAKGET